MAVESRLRSTGRRVIQTVVIAFALLYAASAALYSLPLSPAKLELQVYLNERFAPFFYQNWSLFAPAPVNQDDLLLVHCSSNEQLTKLAEIPYEQWDDIVTPLWDAAREQRFAPWERLSRALTDPVRTFQGNSSEIVPWAAACLNKDERACKIFEHIAAQMRERSQRRLVALGTSYCQAAYPARPLAKVGIRVRQVRPPPWSSRFEGSSTFRDTDVGVFPPSEGVRASSFFVVRRTASLRERP